MQNQNKHWKGKIIAFSLGLVTFVGISTVAATWPDAPVGASNIAGWLGEVFNMNETGTGKLALNAKQLVLPTDYDPILDNKQVTPKKYVDEYVDKKVSASGVSGGGGASFTLVGGNNSIPACPAGYASAMDGYWNCNQSPQAPNCFCASQDGGFSYYNYSFFSGYNQTNRCTVCYPSGSSDSGGITSDATVLWTTKSNFQGNLGGRSGADDKCLNDQPEYLKGKCSNVHAFVGTGNSDNVKDMPNCDMDMDGVIKSWYDCNSPVYWFARQYNIFTQMASSWKDLHDNSISQSAQDAGVYNNSNYWSGDNGSNCSNWTTNSVFQNGYTGQGSNKNVYWYANSQTSCNANAAILCGCRMD